MAARLCQVAGSEPPSGQLPETCSPWTRPPGGQGWKKKEGWAKYVDGYSEPDRWGNEAFALTGTTDMPSTFKQPGPPWSEQNAIYRWYEIAFDCTNGKNENTFRSWDGDNRTQTG